MQPDTKEWIHLPEYGGVWNCEYCLGRYRSYENVLVWPDIRWCVDCSRIEARLTRTRVGLTYFFLIGAVCPLVTYMIHLKWPNSFIRYVKCVSFAMVGRLALTLETYQLPRRLQWSGSHSTCECGQLCPVGDRWLHLPILHSEEIFFVVDQVQLCVLPPSVEQNHFFFVTLTPLPFSCDRRSVLCVGLWPGFCGHSHIFYPRVPE